MHITGARPQFSATGAGSREIQHAEPWKRHGVCVFVIGIRRSRVGPIRHELYYFFSLALLLYVVTADYCVMTAVYPTTRVLST